MDGCNSEESEDINTTVSDQSKAAVEVDNVPGGDLTENPFPQSQLHT